jgi:hypothetical protein
MSAGTASPVCQTSKDKTKGQRFKRYPIGFFHIDIAEVQSTDGQVERINRTIKEATVKRFHYESDDQLRTHLAGFMAAYNFARLLKNASRPHTLRIHRQDLDVRARPAHRQPDPRDAGTKHLDKAHCFSRGGSAHNCGYQGIKHDLIALKNVRRDVVPASDQIVLGNNERQRLAV